MSEMGAVTLRSPSSSCQTLRIERLSLPTGTAMPRAGQISMPTAWTAS